MKRVVSQLRLAHGRIRACMCGRAGARSFASSRVSKLGSKTYKAWPEHFSSLDAPHRERMRYSGGLRGKIPFRKVCQDVSMGARLSRAGRRFAAIEENGIRNRLISQSAAPPIPPYIEPILSAIAVKSLFHRIRRDALNRRA